jgi:hypothetical protein
MARPLIVHRASTGPIFQSAPEARHAGPRARASRHGRTPCNSSAAAGVHERRLDVIGPPLVDEDGHQVGRVRDLVLDDAGRHVLGVTVVRGWLAGVVSSSRCTACGRFVATRGGHAA